MIKTMSTGILVGLMCVIALPAQSQPQAFSIPPGILDQTRQLGDNSIRFCINTSSVLADLDRALAQTIADALLIEATFYDLNSPFAVPPYDFRIPYPERQLFITFNNNCDAFMGVRLSAGNMPEWMTVSRPYYSARSVIVTADPALASFDAFEDGAQISSRMAAPGDVNLTAYLRTLPENDRPSRIPYPDYGLALDRMLDGSVQGAFIWEPALWFASEEDPALLDGLTVFTPPFPVPPIDFGVAFMVDDTFTRGLVDSAIESLRDAGVIDALIAEHVPQPPA